MSREPQPSADPMEREGSIPRSVLIGIAVATVLVLLGGIAALVRYQRMSAESDQSRQALAAMVEICRLREALLEAETAQRGYLLTGDDHYLGPYELALALVPPQLAKLRTTASGGDAELAALESLVAGKLAELREAIERARKGDPAGALAVVRTNAGKGAMDRIREILDRLEAAQSEALGLHLAARSARSREVWGLIPATTGGAVVAMLSALLVLARTYRTRTRADARLHDTETRLRAALSAQLATSEMRARAVLDTIASAIVSIDTAGTVETFNQAAERMFGYRADEMIGRNVRELMPEPHRSQHDAYVRRYLETGERRIIGIGREVVGRRKDGTVFPIMLAVTATPLTGRLSFTGAIRDLTIQKEGEERERRLSRHAAQNQRLADVGAMTARIAHDFGNPLAGLSMTAQRLLRLLGREPLPVERLKEATETMLATARRLDGLVSEFKEFTREQRLVVGDIGVAAFLREIVDAWREEASARGITLALAADVPHLVIQGDPDKLRRVFDNLIKNALEAIDRGPGTVRIAVDSEDGEKIVVSVADSGPGIPAGKDVFALFETTKSTGTGLGLPICQQIVIAHGGGIQYACSDPQGTVFRVELPIHGSSARV